MDKHEFSIYRKPTYTDIATDGSSYCPPSHKHAAFLSMIHRVVSIPLTPKAFKNEVDTIKTIAETNHVKLNIDKIIHDKLVSRALDATTSHPRDTNRKKVKWIRLPYLGNLSTQLSRLLKPLHLRPAFYNVNTMKNHFSRLKDPVPPEEKCGVYILQCDDCPFSYIGQTGRPLKTRLKEHRNAVSRSQPDNSNFAKHLLASGHTLQKSENVRLLHEESSRNKRIALETVEIIKAVHNYSPIVNEIIPTSHLADTVYRKLRAYDDNNDEL